MLKKEYTLFFRKAKLFNSFKQYYEPYWVHNIA